MSFTGLGFTYVSFSLRGKVRDVKKKYPNKKKIKPTKTNKQTNKHTNTMLKPQTNKKHYKPQNHPWNRLKDSSRNILVSIVVKSAFKHLKKIENTIRKSEQFSGSPALHPLQCLVKK